MNLNDVMNIDLDSMKTLLETVEQAKGFMSQQMTELSDEDRAKIDDELSGIDLNDKEAIEKKLQELNKQQ